MLCKDTLHFIANRIGVMSGAKVFQLTEKFDLTIEEVDLLTLEFWVDQKQSTFNFKI